MIARNIQEYFDVYRKWYAVISLRLMLVKLMVVSQKMFKGLNNNKIAKLLCMQIKWNYRINSVFQRIQFTFHIGQSCWRYLPSSSIFYWVVSQGFLHIFPKLNHLRYPFKDGVVWLCCLYVSPDIGNCQRNKQKDKWTGTSHEMSDEYVKI